MTSLPLLDTLSEKTWIARLVEYRVSNGLGYRTKTIFCPEHKTPEQAKNSHAGLEAHLANLKMNSAIPLLRGLYFLLKNAPKDYIFHLPNGERNKLGNFARRIYKFRTRYTANLIKQEFEEALSKADRQEREPDNLPLQSFANYIERLIFVYSKSFKEQSLGRDIPCFVGQHK